jgi:Na+-transporting NADH:ubiquinone oxidoreductase subunit B
MVFVLTACIPPALVGIYNFGWRVLFILALCNLTCWTTEYLFLRKSGKPVTMAALVTGTLLALVMPATIPVWMAMLGCVMAISFGKMVFGGFGKNIFNPAMVGRCFLYIAFPAAMAATWPAPFNETGGGLDDWSRTVGEHSASELTVPAGYELDGVSGATMLAASKRLNAHAKKAEEALYHAEEGTDTSADAKTLKGVEKVISSIDFMRTFVGSEAGSTGETSALALLFSLAYLLYRKVIKIPLVVGPFIGMVGMTILLTSVNVIAIPLGTAIGINVLCGGMIFACIFMTTEPVSAPQDNRARWIYGILIGILGTVIRTSSAFNAGFMFAILLGNMFSPLLDILLVEYDNWKRESAE